MAIKEIKREWSPCQLDYVKTYLLHSEADVKDLPKCCVGSKATVSETDNEYVCTDDGWELGSELGGGEVVILPETELTLSDGQYTFTTPWAVEIVAGGVYVVTYNGVEYECEAYDSPEAPGIMTVMGNSEFLASMGIAGGNPDAPFYLLCLSNAAGAEEGTYGQLSTDGSSSSVTLSIVQTEGASADSGNDGGGAFTARFKASSALAAMELSDCDKSMFEFDAAYRAGKDIRIVAAVDETQEYIGRVVCASKPEGDTWAIFNAVVPFGTGSVTNTFTIAPGDGGVMTATKTGSN